MAGAPTKRIMDEAVTPIKLSDDVWETGFGYYDGSMQPSTSKLDGYTDPTGSTGDTNLAWFPGALGFAAQYHVKGTQTLLAPLLDTTGEGLDVSQDQTNNDGIEYVFGTINAGGPFTFTVGTHNCFLEIRFEIADVSGTDDCAVGWRKAEAFQAAIDDYDEMAAINVISGDVKVETILNNAATTTTDSTQNWADGETHTLRVDVVGRSVEYRLDGTSLTGIPAFSFDNAEVIVPFFYFLQDATSPGKIFWKHVKVGRLRSISQDGSGN